MRQDCYRATPKFYPITPEGWPFVAAGLGVMVLTGWLSLPALAVLAGAFSLFSLYFFRNPKRTTPTDPSCIVSPADGRVVQIAEVVEGEFTGKTMTRVSIFMSPLNVHVNRMPVAGVVKDVRYHPGNFFVASCDKASLSNERNMVYVESDAGVPVVFTQIAGWLARRILCYLKPGDVMAKGERCGLIRYGSRVDIFLPKEVVVCVKLQEQVTAGETILGRTGGGIS